MTSTIASRIEKLVVALRRAGLTTNEIARRIRCDRGTAYVTLVRLQDKHRRLRRTRISQKTLWWMET